MRRQPPPGPVVVLVMLLWSAEIPFCASAITRSQLTAARSAGVRATFARNSARYDRISFTNSAAENVVGDGIQSAGSGNPFAPVPGAFARSIDRCSAAYAESMTAGKAT